MKDQENRIRKIIKNHEKEFGLNPFAETTTNHIIDICCKVINKESSPPPEEQKVKDEFEEWLNEKIKVLMINDKTNWDFAELNAYKQSLKAYLKHTPKQKEDNDEDIRI